MRPRTEKRLLAVIMLIAVTLSSPVFANEITLDLSSIGLHYDTGAVERSTSGIRPILSPPPLVRDSTTNLVQSPRMETDSDVDGICDAFSSLTGSGLSAEYEVQGEQRITLAGSTAAGEALVTQSGLTVSAGNVVSASVRAVLLSPHLVQGYMKLRWRDGSGYLQSGQLDPAPLTLSISGTWRLDNITVPTGATNAEIQIGLQASGSGATGQVSLSLCQVEVKSHVSLFFEGTLPTADVIGASSGSFFEDGVRAPTVLIDGETYKMWFVGTLDTATTIGYAESSDLELWEVGNGQDAVSFTPSLGTALGGPAVLKDGALYKMWLCKPGSPYGIYYATSLDGLKWSVQNGGSAVLASVVNPSVLKRDSTYHMWFEWPGTSGAHIGYATSSDGVSWTVQNSGNGVLDPLTSTFYAYNTFAPSVIWDGSIYRMLFGAQQTSSDSSCSFGYATSPDGVAWTVVRRAFTSIKDGPCLVADHGVARCFFGTHDIACRDSRDWVHWVSGHGCLYHSMHDLDGVTVRPWSSGASYPWVLLDGQDYVMLFTGRYYGSAEYFYTLATRSRDGVNWSTSELLISPDATNYEHGPTSATALMDGGVLKVWFSALWGSDMIWCKVGDGTPVKCERPGGAWLYGLSPSIIAEGDQLTLYYYVPGDPATRFRRARSQDGLTDWSEEYVNVNHTYWEDQGGVGSSLRVFKVGDRYLMWSSTGTSVSYAESEDGLNFEVREPAPFLTTLTGSPYAYNLGPPAAILDQGTYKVWFAGKATSGGTNQIFYAECPVQEVAIAGTSDATDTSGWSELSGVSVSQDAADGDVSFLFSPNDYATVMTYKDGQWWCYYEGGWDSVEADAESLRGVGMTASELAALGPDELGELLLAGDSLQVAAIFNPDTETRPTLASVTFIYDESVATATYQVDTAHYDSSGWKAIDHVYASLIQPEYAEARFFVSVDEGDTLQAYQDGTWTSSSGGTLEEIEAAAETLFANGMTRDELESVDREAFDFLLPASTLDVYAIQQITSESTSGYGARFFAGYVEKFILAARGALSIIMDDGVAYEFDLAAAEVQRFVEWVDLCQQGRGSAYFVFDMPTDGTPYTRLTRRVYYSKILWFEIGEYN